MKTPLLFLLILAAGLSAGCSELVGRVHLTTNPEGVVTAGITISPEIVVVTPEK